MKNTIRARLMIAVIGTAVLMYLIGSALVAHGAEACGTERWPVKTGTDAGAKLLPTAPRVSTVAALVRLPRPRNPDARRSRRFLRLGEGRVYRLSGTLTLLRREADDDYHMVVRGTSGRHMIVEAPSPACARGSAWLRRIAAVRAAVDARFGVTRSETRRPSVRVTVTGVLFFDKKHGQTGLAPNGAELHPLLGIKF